MWCERESYFPNVSVIFLCLHLRLAHKLTRENLNRIDMDGLPGNSTCVFILAMKIKGNVRIRVKSSSEMIAALETV